MRATVILLSFLFLAYSVSSVQIICVGDSWSKQGCPVLKATIAQHLGPTKNVTFLDYSKSGSKALDWIHNGSNYNYLLEALSVSENASDTFIWLSIGGNDVLAEIGKDPTEIMKSIIANIAQILTTIRNQRPLSPVVHFGYDFPRMEEEMLSRINMTVTQVNQGMILFNTVLDSLKATQPNLKTIDIFGCLQRAANTPGAPRVDLPSPAEYMNDPIHPNTDGYKVIMDTFYQSYWKQQLDPEGSYATRPVVTTLSLFMTILAYFVL